MSVRGDRLNSAGFALRIDDQAYDIQTIDREAYGDQEVLRFHIPGALTSSTVTRMMTPHGELIAATLITAKGSYRVRPSLEGSEAFMLEDTQKVSAKKLNLENDTMTSFDVAVRTGNFKLLDTETLAVPQSGRRRAASPAALVVEHKNIAIYSSRFAAHYGGNADNVKLAIQHCFDVRDTNLRDSGVIGIRDTLVYAALRDEPTWLAASHVADKLSMFMSDLQVQALRVQYQANAGYWDDDPNADAGGVAIIIFNDQPSWLNGGYEIEWREALEQVVAHELGHVGGAAHNKANASGGSCPTCYGWYNDYLRDIMTVTCGDKDCEQVPLYSNSSITYQANFWDFTGPVVVGGPDENVANFLSESRYIVRDFWKQVPTH